jgi:vacuolar-type H+-ATPase subunit H
MKNINVDIVKTIILNKLNDSLLNNNLLNESKEILTNFFNIVKDSPILQLEYKIFKNLKNKYIDNDIIATRYIDNNIKLFENYSKEDIINEHNKLNNFINESDLNIISKNDLQLNESIINLIFEISKKDENIPDIDLIHESFLNILNYVKSNKNITENIINENNNYNNNIIEIAIDKFNKKYDDVLNENEKNIFKLLINSTKEEKKSLLENLKTEIVSILENIKNDDINYKINESIEKINKMDYNQKTINEDIITLNDLKSNLK